MKTVVKSFNVHVIFMILVGVGISQANDTRLLAERPSGGSIIERRVKKFGRSAEKVRKYSVKRHSQATGDFWSINDWNWIVYEFNVDPGILLTKALYPARFEHPEFSNYVPLLNGFTWEKWDGWSGIVLCFGEDSLYMNFDTKGRTTESYMSDSYKILVTFDELDRLTRMEHFEQKSDVMVITAKYVITYANDRPREMIKEFFQKGIQVVEKYKYSLSYDDTNNITEIVEFMWNDASGNWETGDTKEIISYTPDGKIKEDTDYYWVESPGSWVGDSKLLFSYNGSGQLTEEIEQGSSHGTDLWENLYRDTYEYDAGGNLVDNKYFSWNDEDSSWSDCQFRNVWLYNADGLMTEDIVYDTDEITGELTEIDKVVYRYELDGNLREEVWYYWEDKEWKKDVKYEYTYDTDGKPAMKSDYLFEVSTGEWELEYESAVMFEYNTGVKPATFTYIKNDIQVKLQNTATFLTVSLPVKAKAGDALVIYDLLGRVISKIKPKSDGNKTEYNWNYTNGSGRRIADQACICLIKSGNRQFPFRIFCQ